ncbi:MAG: TonB-dependent receptor [Acidobacteriaceae bacterium]|nr:TonB-dependent receptor [Acidobacteriaceae bacterium]
MSSRLVRIHRLIFGFALVLFLSVVAHSQSSSSSGAIQGTVKDASGALVPGAYVDLDNISLGITRETRTSADGTYVFPLLQPGLGYRVSVALPGFKHLTLAGLQVSITQTTVANVNLTAGEVTEQVSVEGDAEQISTTSATLGAVVGARVITSLPLSTRNVLDIIGTDAGVTTAITNPSLGITQGGYSVYVAGARATSNNYLFNGVDANNFEFQTLAPGVVPIPSPDSLGEFRTQTSLYDATSGYSSGGNVNLITRSGTSTYHGAAYEFIRNTIFNANDFFLNQKGKPRPVLIQNQFGGSFGGPIPGLRSVFFFVNYEGMRQKNGVLGTTTSSAVPVLPTTINATTLAAAFGLTASQIDPIAVNLLNASGSYGGYLYPHLAGTPGATVSFAYSKPVILNSNQVSSRLDHDFKFFGHDNHLTGTGFVHNQLYTDPSGSGGQPFDYPLGSQHATISDTHIIRDNLINDAVYGYNWDRRDIEATGGATLGQVGMTRSNASVTNLLPDISITNYLSTIQYGANVQHPQHAASFDFHDTLSWLKGRHSFRFGFEARREEFNDGIYLPRGSLTFAGGTFVTGSTAFQDFLTGSPSSIALKSSISRLDFRAHDYIGFVQDDYRVRPRLTLNLGLRYDNLGNPWEIKNEITNFDPTLLSSTAFQVGGAALQPAFVTAGVNGASRTTMLNTNWGSYSPRVGVAYDVFGNGKLAVRGGYGIYYQADGYALQFANSGNPPYQISYSNPSNTAKGILANPFPVEPTPDQFPVWPTFPTLTGVNASTGAPIYSGPAMSIQATDRHIRSPYSQNFNFTVEGEFAHDWTLEVGYLGSRGVRQTSNTQRNSPLLINANNPGRFGLTTNSAKNRESRVPIAGLSSTGFSYLTNNANSSYNAFIATLNHHLSKGFLIKAAYTYSHTVDNFQASASTNYTGSALGNPYSLTLNKGTSAQDVPNRLVVTYVWDLPGFKHSRLNYVLGHWSLAGISIFQNGTAGVVTQSIGSNSFDSATGYGLLASGCSLVSSGRVEDHLNNYLNSSCASTQPLQAAGTVLTGLTPYQTAGSENYTVGTGGGYLVGTQTRGAFHAPFQQRSDLTLSKNFPLRKLGPAGNVEFRAESFKIFNNAIFSAPASAAGVSTFGQISSTIDNTGRQFQFALKASF